MFKAVIFDIDGTIYSYVANDKIALESLCKFAETFYGDFIICNVAVKCAVNVENYRLKHITPPKFSRFLQRE